MWIRGAEVIDGSGAPRFLADVLVENGVIGTVERIADKSLLGLNASRLAPTDIDGTGLILAPGFIDVHTHDDSALLAQGKMLPKLSQGVCTVVTGNCGVSVAPVNESVAKTPAPMNILGSDFRFSQFRDYLSALDQAQPSVNVVPLIGHTNLRVAAMSQLDREATASEQQAMQQMLQEALADGVFGLSTGVYYGPASCASKAELDAVCSVLKPGVDMLTMHIRSEADELESAVEEALAIGKACGARLVLSHHKAIGKNNWGKTAATLRTIEEAAKRQSVCLDCYPYNASSTVLDAKKAASIADVLITWSQPHPDCAGQNLKDIASRWQLDLESTASKLMPGGAIYFGMDQADVDRVLSHPLAMIGSDGLPGEAWPHPRLWGSFPRVLGHYSRERRLFPLESAIHKMTGLPAERFGLSGRGKIAPGYAADIVLFDQQAINDSATYLQPEAQATGIHSVFVNGCLVFSSGNTVDLHAGKRLRPSC